MMELKIQGTVGVSTSMYDRMKVFLDKTQLGMAYTITEACTRAKIKRSSFMANSMAQTMDGYRIRLPNQSVVLASKATVSKYMKENADAS